MFVACKRNLLKVCKLAMVLAFGVFAATPAIAQFTYVDRYDFSFNSGSIPFDIAQLAQGTDGNLYGTTEQGGAHNFGTIFSLTPTGVYTDLWDFDGVTGENTLGGLTLASDGNFYGVATGGGTFNYGTVFRFTPPNSVTVLHHFTGSTDGWNPYAPPVQGSDGNLYGVTSSGTVYTITLPSGTFTALSQGTPTGVYAPLYLASDGNLYGTSADGGDFGLGTVFRVKTPSGAIKVMSSFFGPPDGQNPYAPVVQFSDGFLYGTTSQVTNGGGTIYRISLAGKMSTEYEFSAVVNNTNTDGASPYAGLLYASDGYMYGVTSAGGSNGGGTIYQFKPGTSPTKLFDFSAPPLLANYATNLMQHTNGSFFGVASTLGSGNGTFYNLTQPNLLQILQIAGPIFVLPGGPVQILGNGLTRVVSLNFAIVPAVFRAISDTQLTATVPMSALDGVIGGSYDTGLPIATVSSVHILPLIQTLDPLSGPAGTLVTITGGGFTGATKVKFNGVAATEYTVVSATMIQATVPSGATKGKVTVKTPNGKATSTQKFVVK